MAKVRKVSADLMSPSRQGAARRTSRHGQLAINYLASFAPVLMDALLPGLAGIGRPRSAVPAAHEV